MKPAQHRAVVSALQQAHVLITADRKTHHNSWADARTGLIVPKAERALAKAYNRALRDIDKALQILQPAPAVIDQGTGFLPKKLEKLGSKKP